MVDPGLRLPAGIFADSSGNVVSSTIHGLAAGARLAPEFPVLAEQIGACVSGTPFHARVFFRQVLVEIWGSPVANGIFLILHPGAPVPVSNFEFVINNLSQGLWRLDGNGRILYANPFLVEWLEASPGEVEGHASSQYLQTASNDVRFEADFLTKTGEKRKGLVTRQTLPHGKGTVDLIVDITANHQKHTELRDTATELAHLASTDPMTGLLNRRALLDEMNRLTSIRPRKEFALLLVDADNLKDINDRYGHAMGDAALMALSATIRTVVRETDAVARLGGDEFVVLLPEASMASAREVALRLRRQMPIPVGASGVSIGMTASIGIAHSSRGIGRILERADQSMYREKRQRKEITPAVDLDTRRVSP